MKFISGMLIGTLFTLLILPSVHLQLATTHQPKGQPEDAGRDTLNRRAPAATPAVA